MKTQAEFRTMIYQLGSWAVATELCKCFTEEQLKIWAGNYSNKMGAEFNPPDYAVRVLELVLAVQAMRAKARFIERTADSVID